MTALTRRSTSPVSEMLDWLESGFPMAFKPAGLGSYIRVEDFVEEGTYVLRSEIPGIDPDKDVEITVTADTLSIKGERREEQKDKRHHEFHYGSFARSVSLPPGTKPEDVTASYQDGVLEVRVPMAETASETRQVKVTKQT